MKNEIKTIDLSSGQAIILDKQFGPLIMTPIKIYIDRKRGEWIIEREVTPLKGELYYEVCARIDGQNSIEFYD